jgi:hypothetical protein
MEQAQRLMLRHAISEVELDGVAPNIVEIPYLNPTAWQKQAVRDQLVHIASVIGPIFGCYPIIRAKGHELTELRFVGFPVNIQIAAHAMDCIIAQGLIEARALYREYRTATFTEGFWKGYAIGLQLKFQAKEQSSPENGIELYDKVKQHIAEKYKGTYSDRRGFSENGQNAGLEAGSKAELRRGLETGNQGRLLR